MFKAEKAVAIPNKDLISWTFDDNKFDQDEPVSHIYSLPLRSVLRECRLLRLIVLTEFIEIHRC